MTSERDAYHHGALRESLIASSLRAVEAKGAHLLSLRKQAGDAGVDVAAVYRHFRAKDDLLAAVGAQGLAELSQEMKCEMESVGRTKRQARAYFRACGRAYVRFGVARPHLYRLMFGGRHQVSAMLPDTSDDTPTAFYWLQDAIALLGEAKLLSAESVIHAEAIAWSCVHGIVTLRIDGRGSAEAPQALADEACRVLLRGWARSARIVSTPRESD